MNIDKELELFCRNIRYLHISHGISKKKMAQLLGIGIRSLNRLEAGDFPAGIKISVFFRIHRIFGVLPSSLIGDNFSEQEEMDVF